MQDRGLLCLHCPLCAFHTSVISTGALFEAVTSNPSAVTGCRASSQSNLQRQLCNHGPGSGGQLRKRDCASLAEYSGSWWRRRHGWGGSRNRYFEVSPRQTKKELEEKKLSERHGQFCTPLLIQFEQAALPSHPLQEPVCLHEKTEMLVLKWLKLTVEILAPRQAASSDGYLQYHVCTMGSASGKFSCYSTVLQQQTKQHNNVRVTQYVGIMFNYRIWNGSSAFGMLDPVGFGDIF